jgi:hypothetical protein
MTEPKKSLEDLERLRRELDEALREREVALRRLNRDENRLRNALKKQDAARTHRLIVEGAELEYVFDGIEDLPQDEFWKFMRTLKTVPGVSELYSKAKAGDLPPAEGGED